jgi:AcrR family transcriptional regulator
VAQDQSIRGRDIDQLSLTLLEFRTMLEEADEDSRAVRRAANRARILSAAWELARREGVAAITLRDVARRVGMRAPSLYTYFSSKNAMYDAMYAGGARAMAEVLSHRPEGTNPRGTLRNRMRSFIGFCMADPARYQLILERPIPGFAPTPESFQITVAALAGTRADMEAAGVHGERLLDLWRAVITGLVSLQIANDPGGDRWTRLQDDAFDMFFAHFGGKNPGGANG